MRRPRRAWLPALAGALVLAGAVVGVVIGGGSPAIPGAGIAPAIFVMSATHTTLSQRTADLIFRGRVSVAGHSTAITGSGQAIFSNPQQLGATVDVAVPGGGLTEREILADNHFYLALSSAGQDISSLVPGKHWVEIPIPINSADSVGTGTSDPLAQLQLLASQGNTVKALGTKSIDGVTASGYSVTLSRSTIINAELRYLATSNLTPAEQQQIGQAAQNSPTPTIDVWFDSSKLLRRIGFVTNQTQNGTNIAVNVEVDFVNYGTPVSISAPSPSDVASYSQFLAAAQAASGDEGGAPSAVTPASIPATSASTS